MDETSFKESEYLQWFREAAHLCFLSSSLTHPVIFYQTDRLYKGMRISKCSMLMHEAEKVGYTVVYHKIVLRRDPGKIDLRRPGYSHLLCFGTEGVTAGKATPDVFHAGGVLYPNGTGLQAATVALQTALRHGSKVCDPFCGRGTIPAIAEAMGFEKVVGVDIDPAQCEAARTIRMQKHNTGGIVKPSRSRLFGA
jgi:ribosomal protein L11 methylase PrmA